VKIAVVFDTPRKGWEHDDFLKEVAAKVEEAEYEVAAALIAGGHDVRLIGVWDDLHHLLDRLHAFQPDLVFNCAEGFDGQAALDYVFAGVLEAQGLTFTGSPALGLIATRNKAVTKQILSHCGIKVAGFEMYRLDESVNREATFTFPLIVKPLQEDASAGISQASIVWDREALVERVDFVHQNFTQPAIVEEFVPGRELYVGMLGNGSDLEILPLVEMVWGREVPAEERVATRLAKWDDAYRGRKGIRNVFARPISKRARETIAECCRTAFRALWLRDYARLDVRLTPEDEVWVIEANANPYISYGHDMANAAEKAGFKYPAFIQRIADEALRRHDH